MVNRGFERASKGRVLVQVKGAEGSNSNRQVSKIFLLMRKQVCLVLENLAASK